MSGWLWNEVTHAWAPGLTDARSGGGMPLRTVYNPRTHQHEEIPLSQFQQLLYLARTAPVGSAALACG